MTEKAVRVADLEEVIREIRGVEAARIVVDRQGTIEEIHVLVRGDRGAKQLVRDVESALMAKYGLKIDHKKVSIAQIGSGNGSSAPTNGKQAVATPTPVAAPRPGLVDLSMTIDGAQLEATVRLTHGEQVVTGSASGHSTPRNQLRILAQATARAVELALGAPDTILVEEVTQVKLPGDRAAVNAVICLMGSRSEEHLLGAALIKQDAAKATVYATLDALNRRYGLLAKDGSKADPEQTGPVSEPPVNGEKRAEGELQTEAHPARFL